MDEIEKLPITKDISIAAPWPALFIEDESLLVASDLHLGLEDEQQTVGVHMPISTFPKVFNFIAAPAKALGCRRVILLGDVKHEFGRPVEAEWYSVKKLVKGLREIGCEPEVVRGNHDNYIITVLKELNVKFHDPSLRIGDILLIHGHQPILAFEKGVEHVILGHEHPVLSVKDDVGIRHRYKAFLTGRIGGRRYTVLPSVSPLSYGFDINEIAGSQRLSPILMNRSLEDFTSYVIEVGVAVKKFPKLRYL